MKVSKYIWLKVILLLLILGCKKEQWIMTNSDSPKILLFEVCPNPNIKEETEARDLYRFFTKSNTSFQIITNDKRWQKQTQLSKALIENSIEAVNPEIIHIAIHGESTRLAIAEHESLTTSDMKNMNVWKDKIIVSGACEGGKYAQLLLNKGAKMVVASNKKILWPNQGKFFSKFYEGLLTKIKPELALEEAIHLYPEYESYKIHK